MSPIFSFFCSGFKWSKIYGANFSEIRRFGSFAHSMQASSI